MSMLVGLGGRLRSGKDVVADRLVSHHGFVKLGMSDALHEAMLALDPIIDEGGGCTQELPVTYSEAIERYGYVDTKGRFPEARRLLQKLGTEVGREMIDTDVWVKIMAEKIRDKNRDGLPVVVTGIRFPNELEMIHDLDGDAWWVERPGIESAGAGGHKSESGVSEKMFDTTLHNDSTIIALELLADSMVALDVT